ncbi:unnamed protein product [Jaminaea pallidilutea]
MADTLYVAYLGPPGTYSHQVALGLHPECKQQQDRHQHQHQQSTANAVASTSARTILVPCPTIRAALDYALDPEALEQTNTETKRRALIPIKNSTHGVVKETVAGLEEHSARRKVKTLQTVQLPVQHALLAGPRTYEALAEDDGTVTDEALERIQKVMSHEQALGQCKHYLDKYLPLTANANGRIETSSTALAASELAKEEQAQSVSGAQSGSVSSSSSSSSGSTLVAAIASDICATESIYDVKLLRSSIQDRGDNTTTFVLVECDIEE